MSMLLSLLRLRATPLLAQSGLGAKSALQARANPLAATATSTMWRSYAVRATPVATKKEPAAKKPATAAKKAKTPVAKKSKADKTKAKKKVVAKKPKAKKAPLTPEEKAKIHRKKIFDLAKAVPQPPVRPTSSYGYYVAEQWAQGHTNPADGAGVSEHTSQAMSQSWRALTEGERERYSVIFQRDLDAFHSKHEAWYKSLTNDQIRTLNRKTRIQRREGRHITLLPLKGLPPRPLSSFIRFCVAYKLNTPGAIDKGTLNGSALAGAAWRSLPQAEKEVYVRAASADFEAYRAAVKANAHSL